MKKRELLQAKKDFEEIMDERNEEINTIKESIDLTMKEFLSKGEKAAFLTRDLIIKINQFSKLIKEEKRLSNIKLISQSIKDLTMVTNKIYDHVRVYDVNGKLATIDLQTIEATQQQ